MSQTNADPYPGPDPGSQTNAVPDPDPDPGQTLTSKKSDFDINNIGHFSCSWIRICIPIRIRIQESQINADLWIWIRNTAGKWELLLYINMRLLDPVQRQEVERAGDLEHPQAPLCLVHRPEHKSHLRAGTQSVDFQRITAQQDQLDRDLRFCRSVWPYIKQMVLNWDSYEKETRGQAQVKGPEVVFTCTQNDQGSRIWMRAVTGSWRTSSTEPSKWDVAPYILLFALLSG